MAARPITTVTFDAGNTLLYCDPSPAEIYAEALTRHGRAVEVGDVAPVFAAAWADFQQRTPPGVDRYGAEPGGEIAWWGAFLRQVLARLDHDADWQPLLEDLYTAFLRPEVWRVFPETRRTLDLIADRGLHRAVISNWDRRLPELLANLGLAESFELITVSAIEGVEKPAAEIFRRTLDRLGARPDETLHVGDSPLEDFEGSKAAGMIPVLIDRSGVFATDGYRRISSLDEVLTLLG
jgi:putative hydrolase of the HAD superfamily